MLKIKKGVKNMKLTWKELYAKLCKQCSCSAFADNIIGRWMDEAESWDWDAVVPDDVITAAKTQKII